MEPFQKAGLSLVLQSWMDCSPTLIAGITTRHGGTSSAPFDSMNLGFHVPDKQDHVLKNRGILAESLQFPVTQWVMGEQVHDTVIKVVDDTDLGKGAMNHDNSLAGIDGLITNQHGILCTAMFADCVPLYFYDPVSGWIGVAHAGWRGSVNRMAEKMVNTLKEQGVDVTKLLVAIGPCIGRNAYEVDEKVIRQVPTDYRKKVVTPKENGRFLLDLRTLNREILLDSGISEENIDVSNYCTCEDDLFFSHRGDQGTTGRMLGFIGYKEK